MPFATKKWCASSLSDMRAETSASGSSTSAGASCSRARASTGKVEVVERNDEADVVLRAQRCERRDVVGSAIRGTMTCRSQW